MYLIKLNAISSTNDFLKDYDKSVDLPNFTVVWADVQTKGKGQMGNVWLTEGAKNLTFSLLLKGDWVKIELLQTINVMVANAVLKALKQFNLTNIYVKWPNDILSYNKKIAGILIENSFKANGSIETIVGIGINVSQTNFDEFPLASSIQNQYNIAIDKQLLLNTIVEILKQSISIFNDKDEWAYYHDNLFRKDVLSVFEFNNGNKFNGIIKKVNHHGQLVVQLEDDDLQCFNLKEVKLLY